MLAEKLSTALAALDAAAAKHRVQAIIRAVAAAEAEQ
jgi:hypothetical protein